MRAISSDFLTAVLIGCLPDDQSPTVFAIKIALWTLRAIRLSVVFGCVLYFVDESRSKRRSKIWLLKWRWRRKQRTSRLRPVCGNFQWRWPPSNSFLKSTVRWRNGMQWQGWLVMRVKVRSKWLQLLQSLLSTQQIIVRCRNPSLEKSNVLVRKGKTPVFFSTVSLNLSTESLIMYLYSLRKGPLLAILFAFQVLVRLFCSSS